MLTVTLDELAVNAITAALDARVSLLTEQLARISAQPKTASRDFTCDTLRLALGQALRTRIDIATQMDEPEYPADMTVGRLDECDYAGQWGK